MTTENSIIGMTSSGKEYELVSFQNGYAKMCFLRGFMPQGDAPYIDEVLIREAASGEYLAIIPEVEEKAQAIIADIVEDFEETFDTEGHLPGRLLVNMATWVVAWSIEMAWCWSEDNLDACAFSQDMDDFHVPMDKFTLIPNDWINDLVTTFMAWCYGNPGYTNRHEIDIYDPIRDGYLTMVRLVATRFLAVLQKTS